jgi:hypothetical protein
MKRRTPMGLLPHSRNLPGQDWIRDRISLESPALARRSNRTLLSKLKPFISYSDGYFYLANPPLRRSRIGLRLITGFNYPTTASGHNLLADQTL